MQSVLLLFVLPSEFPDPQLMRALVLLEQIMH